MKKERAVRYLKVSNIAQQHWCHQFSIYRAVEDEKMVKEAVKQLNSYPNNKAKINHRDTKYKYLPKHKLRELMGISKNQGEVRAHVDAVKNIVYLPTPGDILEIGEIEQHLFAERYPTVKTFFTWGKYTVLACPDGISDDFCYEFKSTSNPFLYFYVKPVALSQVHIYSYFYKKPKVRAQIRIRSTEEIKTIKGRRDNTRVAKALDTMDKLLMGKIKPIPPRAWKCKKCEYRKECPVRGKK